MKHLFLEERYEKIIELIKVNGRVKVKDLSNLFEVTQDCIR
ncbi:MAG: DeoR family transcriptional regulator, partial [Paraclostridium sp.]